MGVREVAVVDLYLFSVLWVRVACVRIKAMRLCGIHSSVALAGTCENICGYISTDDEYTSSPSLSASSLLSITASTADLL